MVSPDSKWMYLSPGIIPIPVGTFLIPHFLEYFRRGRKILFYTSDWALFKSLLFPKKQSIRPKIKKNVCLLYPYLPTLPPPLSSPPPKKKKKKNIGFLLLFFSSENHDFPITQKCKKKKKKKKKNVFPTYVPNQKIQGRGTANKQFFKDGLSL